MLRFVLRLIAATLLLASLGAFAPGPAGGGCHGRTARSTPRATRRSSGWARAPSRRRSSTSRSAPQVRFLNTAQVDHLVVGESQTWGTQSTLVPGKELARTFAEKGVYPFSCPLHPGMVGAVVVGGADAAAVPPPAAAGGDSRAVGNAAPAVPAAGATQGAETAPHRRPARRRPSCWSSGRPSRRRPSSSRALAVAAASRHAVARGVAVRPDRARQARLTPGPVATASTVPTRHAPTPAASRSASTAARRSRIDRGEQPARGLRVVRERDQLRGDAVADGERRCREPPVVRGAAGLDAGPGEVERARRAPGAPRRRTRGAPRTRAPSRGRGPAARSP